MPVAFHPGRPVPLEPGQGTGGPTAPHPFGEWGKSFVFTNELVQDLRESTELTREDGNERGFFFCQDPNTKVTGKNALNRTRMDKEAVPLPVLDEPWVVLNAAGRCKGDHCGVVINRGCEPVTDWARTQEELKRTGVGVTPKAPGWRFQLANQSFGKHHTHPDRRTSSPSPGDKLNLVYNALYDGQPAMGCITGVRLKETPLTNWSPNGDAIGCYAIPPSLLPSTQTYDEWRKLYNDYVRPYYDAWEKSPGGFQPTRENYADYGAYRSAYDKIEQETDAILARIEFPNIDKMAEGTVHTDGSTGGGRDKTTKYAWMIKNTLGEDSSDPMVKPVLSWIGLAANKANIAPSVDLRYFNTYKVRTHTTSDERIKRLEREARQAQERQEQERREREEQERLKREEQYRLERDKQTLERIRARRKQAMEEGQGTGFIEEFGSLENCLKGVFAGGGKMSGAQFMRIARANGVNIRQTKSEICEELAAMETVIHA